MSRNAKRVVRTSCGCGCRCGTKSSWDDVAPCIQAHGVASDVQAAASVGGGVVVAGGRGVGWGGVVHVYTSLSDEIEDKPQQSHQ